MNLSPSPQSTTTRPAVRAASTVRGPLYCYQFVGTPHLTCDIGREPMHQSGVKKSVVVVVVMVFV